MGHGAAHTIPATNHAGDGPGLSRVPANVHRPKYVVVNSAIVP